MKNIMNATEQVHAYLKFRHTHTIENICSYRARAKRTHKHIKSLIRMWRTHRLERIITGKSPYELTYHIQTLQKYQTFQQMRCFAHPNLNYQKPTKDNFVL